MTDRNGVRFKKWRLLLIIIILLLVIIALIVRMAYLTVIDSGFLNKQGAYRSIRVEKVPAYRGMLLDCNGNPLAVSTPVQSVWVNPSNMRGGNKEEKKLVAAIGLPLSYVQQLLAKNSHHHFIYVKRNVDPQIADKIKAMKLPGVYFEQSYRRFYPDGAATAHILGFTNIDNKGISGLESVFNKQLQGKPGKKIVKKDRSGNTIAVIGEVQQAQPGHDVKLSIDQRIQFLAYSVLKQAVNKFQADSGSAIVLSVNTGQILAMTNLPSYNPNNKPADKGGRYRNRAMTDVYEPGSVMKTFAIINGLQSGKFTPNTEIDTNPGYLYLNGHRVDDENVNHGVLTVTQVLAKSSNIGITKMMLKLPSDSLWQELHDFGFGQLTGAAFPGQEKGFLVNHRRWAPIMIATLSFGYGMSATPLQIARAYAAIANHGELLPVTFRLGQKVQGEQIISPEIAHKTVKMLQAVVSRNGTGFLAKVPGYQVAGKTGTARIAKPGGYSHHHIATFVSIAPASNPQFVVLVMLRHPHSNHYYATYLAAPACEKIMAGVLQLRNVPPDDINSLKDSDKSKKHWVAPV